MSKPWWQKKKLWGTLLGAAFIVFGERWGMDPAVASRAAWMLFGGVSVEGIVDAVSAFGQAWRKE